MELGKSIKKVYDLNYLMMRVMLWNVLTLTMPLMMY